MMRSAWPASHFDLDFMAIPGRQREAGLARQICPESEDHFTTGIVERIVVPPNPGWLGLDRAEGLPFAIRVKPLQLDQLPFPRKGAPSYAPAEPDRFAIEDVVWLHRE